MMEDGAITAEVVLTAPPGRDAEQSFGVVRLQSREASSAGSLAITEIDRATEAGSVITAYLCKSVPIPAGLDLDLALLIPPLATALAVWGQLKLELGDAAVCIGDGPLTGLLGQAALWRGASPVVVIGSLQSHQLPSGITTIGTESSDDLVKAITSATARCPGWAAVETTGRPEMLDVILDAVPKWGRIALCGGATSAATVDFYNNVHRKGIQINGSALAPTALFAKPHAQRLLTYATSAARILSHPSLARTCRRLAS